MRRTILLLFSTLSILFFFRSLEAQQPKKIPRIGLLLGTSPSVAAANMEVFREALRGVGYVEGKNIAVEYRFAEGKYERLPGFAADLVHLNVDVILAQTTPASRAAKQATKTVPIVFVAVSDPVGSGLVANLARPGGNITGIANVAADLLGKQLELLKEALPNINRVGLLWNPASIAAPYLGEIKAAARVLKVQLQFLEVTDAKNLDNAFSAMRRERADAFMVIADAMFSAQRQRITDFATKNRLATMSWLSSFSDAGGLISYGPSTSDQYRRAAIYVDKILKGAKPADLPVEQPTKFELVINLKTAKQIGVTIPQSVLYRADKVIK